MNITSRRVLRLAGIGVFAIAVPQLASAFDSGSGTAFKMAMGPTSAAQKSQGPSKATDDTAAPPKPHHHAKHKQKSS